MRSSPFAPLDRRLAPAPDVGRVAFLLQRTFAHRGLHGGDVPENSRAAFSAAITAGEGIECDVQASRDGRVFVFHDSTLDRLTREQGPLAARAARELERITLANGETLPTLEEMLALVGGKVPLLVEVKAPDRHVVPLCLAVRRALEGYRGPVAVMAFNPEVGRWFAARAPRIVRGLVVTEEGNAGWRGRIERHVALWRAKPDFLAYDVRDLPSCFAAAQRARGLPVLTWTVRGEALANMARLHADGPIHERA